MRDTGWITAGLAAFLVVVTFPIWYDLSAGVKAKAPELKLPSKEKQCVAPTAYMRTSHMELLTSWRDDVVRRNDRIFKTSDGRTFTKSLTGTCLNCHENKAEFCDRCHTYSAVTVYCWDCHVDPKEVRKGTQYARR